MKSFLLSLIWVPLFAMPFLRRKSSWIDRNHKTISMVIAFRILVVMHVVVSHPLKP
jgi:hypothetical protein